MQDTPPPNPEGLLHELAASNSKESQKLTSTRLSLLEARLTRQPSAVAASEPLDENLDDFDDAAGFGVLPAPKRTRSNDGGIRNSANPTGTSWKQAKLRLDSSGIHTTLVPSNLPSSERIVPNSSTPPPEEAGALGRKGGPRTSMELVSQQTPTSHNKPPTKITQYLHRVSRVSEPTPLKAANNNELPENSYELEHVSKENLDLRNEVQQLQETLRKSETMSTKLADQLEATRACEESMKQEVDSWRSKCEQMKANFTSQLGAWQDALAVSRIAQARSEREEMKNRVQAATARYGNITIQRTGTMLTEVWEDGCLFTDLIDRQEQIAKQRESIDKRLKSMRQKDKQGTAIAESFEGSEDLCRAQLQRLKREDEALSKDKEELEKKKGQHIRDLKRLKDEESSRFRGFPRLKNGRYQLLNLLGKGGFSEVYLALDLEEGPRTVACKLHQLNSQWSEQRKQSYVRHAIREYNIHKSLDHPRVVKLFDIFEIDNNTFCTVLEYCEGGDLDAHLKTYGTLPEREARAFLIQIVAALQHLSVQRQPVIHYDLKPGNILFDSNGEVKLTDFGLSKIVESDHGASGMELTSQGAGTYWYLPPECFGVQPKISNKVDVWAAGVIFYQMIYGKRPFGHDLTQERILREETIIRSAKELTFPAKPALSEDAKDIIKACLEYRQEDRPDVTTLAAHSYVQPRPNPPRFHKGTA